MLKGLQIERVKQKWLAEKMGVSEVTISNWVTEEEFSIAKEPREIEHLLDVSINELI